MVTLVVASLEKELLGEGKEALVRQLVPESIPKGNETAPAEHNCVL